MHTVHAPKRDDMTIRIEIDPSARRMPLAGAGRSTRHKDKRRKAKVKERASLRKGDFGG